MNRAAAAIAALALLALAGWAGWSLYEAGHLSRAGIIELAGRTGPWAPLCIIALMVLAVVVGPIPTVPISVASGLVFGPWMGFAYAMGGALLGAAIAFGLGRLLGRPFMERFFAGHIAFCADCSDRLLFAAVLAARLVPVVSFAFVSYAAGLTAMRLVPYLVATAIGMLPMTVVYVVAGSMVRIDPLLAVPAGLAAVALILALPWLVERYNPLGLRDRLAHGPSHPPGQSN